MNQQPTIGIALSGGGVRGAAHAGLFKALEENGIEVTQFSGSSAGAMAGALYAAGYGPEDILEFFKISANNIFQWRHFARSKPGILDSDQYAELFEPWLKDHTFESLSKKLHICVTDVLKGEIRFFSSGELVRPILASAAVPGVFSPVDIGENWYIDGGTMNNFPLEPLMGQCDVVLGSYVSLKKVLEKNELDSTLQLLNRASDLSFLALSLQKFKDCSLVFAPSELWQYGSFDSKKIDEIYQIGYEHACSKMDSLLAILDRVKADARNME
ncbi:MAG: patatin-like phospholipase family protein [Phaeodactylibacter sp.]|nr:patatin-like phospholipase family protein [Phaeodactylibacter sp.]MCB9301897.1 patatin-like phospholipase family protein [Lewinellaceae bacterium]HQU60981.1 patatin-like phospholipase family protein [Saprospiraceae bacterium]